uniref:ATP synthase F0 subunit 6 n=1 Tax=Sirex nitobei TaxID=1602346 RepID=UPI0023D8BE98|nr:ATP synthase F0 subunit 6 [Sirex nitobei]WDR47212.1 ATP synthase F0 subunit 6 [Sirex nitobei]
MMMNLFSNFDPMSTSLNLSMNWLSSILWMFFFPLLIWSIPSRYYLLKMLIYKYILQEIKPLINEKKNSFMPLIFICLFTFILINNILSLFPFIFTSTSHLTFSLSLALPIWLTFMYYNLTNFFTFTCAHMLPMNTPLLLMPFMVIIETISAFIRPITLSIRLSANMISGHLLLTLLGMASSSFFMSNLMIFCQFILLILEISVSFIQAYVFAMLMSLYFKETIN